MCRAELRHREAAPVLHGQRAQERTIPVQLRHRGWNRDAGNDQKPVSAIFAKSRAIEAALSSYLAEEARCFFREETNILGGEAVVRYALFLNSLLKIGHGSLPAASCRETLLNNTQQTTNSEAWKSATPTRPAALLPSVTETCLF